jgi:hypothetical protein
MGQNSTGFRQNSTGMRGRGPAATALRRGQGVADDEGCDNPASVAVFIPANRDAHALAMCRPGYGLCRSARACLQNLGSSGAEKAWCGRDGTSLDRPGLDEPTGRGVPLSPVSVEAGRRPSASGCSDCGGDACLSRQHRTWAIFTPSRKTAGASDSRGVWQDRQSTTGGWAMDAPS